MFIQLILVYTLFQPTASVRLPSRAIDATFALRPAENRIRGPMPRVQAAPVGQSKDAPSGTLGSGLAAVGKSGYDFLPWNVRIATEHASVCPIGEATLVVPRRGKHLHLHPRKQKTRVTLFQHLHLPACNAQRVAMVAGEVQPGIGQGRAAEHRGVDTAGGEIGQQAFHPVDVVIMAMSQEDGHQPQSVAAQESFNGFHIAGIHQTSILAAFLGKHIRIGLKDTVHKPADLHRFPVSCVR